MYENYSNYNSYNFSSKPPRRKRRAAGSIALVLVTAVISSYVVGSVLLNRFNNEIEDIKKQTLNTIVSSREVSENGSASKISDTSSEEYKASAAVVNTNTPASATALAKGSDVTAIAKKAGPSIVGIRMTVGSTRKNRYGVLNSQVSEGSGIIIRQDGYIMTNYHVVSNADPKSSSSSYTVLEVFLPDGREAKATFVGGDSKTDLAVIKIDLTKLPVADLGDSSDLEVGELAVAIGNPLGMEFAGSVTVGVISALNRTVEIDDRTMNLIQTDAAINSGNSGGALLNSKGEVIGINSAKISASGVEGLGFAIPINDAKPIVDQLMTYGYVKGRPYIGISGIDITDTISLYYSLPKGVYVSSVGSGSAAEKAGIKVGDVITKMDGKTIESMSDLEDVKEKHKAGDKVSVVIVRNNTTMTLNLTFDEDKQ
jgi:serine protease Do